MSFSKIDKAIATIEFILKKRKDLVDRESRKVEISENKKIYIGQETELIQCCEVLIRRYKDDINKNMGKLPPQALEIEQAIIGAIIFEPTDGEYNGVVLSNQGKEVVKILIPEHFYDERHKLTFSACLSLLSRNGEINLRTIVTELRRLGHLEIVGAYYLAEVAAIMVNRHNLLANSRILIERAVKRELLVLAGQIISEGYDDTRDCFEMLESAEETFKGIKSWIK